MTADNFLREFEAAKEAVKLAGSEVLEVYKTSFEVEIKNDNSPVTLADKKANDIITRHLESFPHKLISEEGNIANVTNETTWLIDPLDGTADFINRNDEFCVMIALVNEHKPLFGVIYEPITDTLYYAMKGHGAFKEHQGKITKLQVSAIKDLSDCKYLLSRLFPSEKAVKFSKYLGCKNQVPIGSMGLRFCRMAEGKAEFFCTFGTPKIWDVCPGQIILEEAGGVTTDINGKTFFYEKIRFENSVIAINHSNKDFFKKLHEFCQKEKI